MKFSTFTIVARDEQTGDLAVAGGTNWFNYGRWVLHAEAGVGALATQAETNMWYAPNGLTNLRNGMSAKQTLEDLLKRDDDLNGVYQLLILDNQGNTVCHTGKSNHQYAGSMTEDNFAIAGNTLVSKATLEAATKYFHNSTEPFPLKIIKALQAGQDAGGDIRGMKSAALKIVKSKSSGKYWDDTIFDLRVDENTNPLLELERLYHVALAYQFIGQAEDAENPQKALHFYQKALEIDPNNSEIKFWIAWTYNNLGMKTESQQILETLSPNWHQYWERLKSHLSD